MESTKIVVFVIWFFYEVSGVKLTIENDGPVVEGSNITFVGLLEDVADYEYMWTWTDNFKPSTKVEILARNQCNFTHSYKQAGEYIMTVNVKFYLLSVASAENKFFISSRIPGRLEVFQHGVLIPSGHYLSSANNTLLVTRIHDPSGYLEQALLHFVWNINNDYIVGENKANLTHVFNPPDDWQVLVVVTAYFPQFRYYIGGSFNTYVRSRAPIETINVTGKVLLKHGDLVELLVECDGSGPWSYCWMAVPQINGTDAVNATCTDITTTNDCEIQMIYYFETSGHHQMLINISNDINRMIQVVDITIYNVVPEPQLSTVLIPVVCSLLAVAIVVVGILFYVQTRHRFTIEVADFDFTSSDTFTYRTFCQQLKDAIIDSIPSRSDRICERNWNFFDCRSEPEGQTSPVEFGKGDFFIDDIRRRQTDLDSIGE